MKDMIVLHHSANPTNNPQAKQIVQEHLNNPNIRQASGYHYIIERSDGSIQKMHDEDFIGYHAGNYAVNVRSIGICMAGDLSKQSPTEAQIESLFQLITDIQNRWGIQDANIKLHREVRLLPTACPCMDLRAVFFAQRVQNIQQREAQLENAERFAQGERLLKIKQLLDRLLNTP